MKGWHLESIRHALARKGIKTNKADYRKKIAKRTMLAFPAGGALIGGTFGGIAGGLVGVPIGVTFGAAAGLPFGAVEYFRQTRGFIDIRNKLAKERYDNPFEKLNKKQKQEVSKSAWEKYLVAEGVPEQVAKKMK